jgi:4-diphosphocytidyl-2C-methyl-D-erythritol kinase
MCVEAVRYIYNKYKIKVLWYIGDGDSDCFHKLRTLVEGFGMRIKKIECTNHVMKCLRKSYESMSHDLSIKLDRDLIIKCCKLVRKYINEYSENSISINDFE